MVKIRNSQQTIFNSKIICVHHIRKCLEICFKNCFLLDKSFIHDCQVKYGRTKLKYPE